MSPDVPVPGALPYLTVRRGVEAIAWYSKVFGAEVVGEPIVMDDGRVGHAELRLPTGMIYLAEEFPEMGLTAPESGSTSVSLMLRVDDPDAVLVGARDAGGKVERWISEGHGHRNATLIDPFGHRWMLVGPTDPAASA
ncbi:VOC family protein [Rhodococcus opacus]|nr:VOC family protein [Rhodococcus opacus]RZL82228.1 MAG: VOC family protein [Rhodococcus sp. (in: high G+C Gram-positive bacteria)]